MQGHQQYWLGLHLIRDFGIVKQSRLLAHFDSAEALWQASEAQLARLELPRGLLRQFLAGRGKIDLAHEKSRVGQAGAGLLTLADAGYPSLLRSLADRPPLLYMRGQLNSQDKICLAIVGTRRASKYGRDVARHFAYELARQGITIVSGLAHGIDTAAHRGALQAAGRTIAVLGSGIDSIYPRENLSLAEEIMKNGALLSEMPLGAPPLGKNFPQRNRIISGLSLGLLVVEAPQKSGAMNSVSHALEQGRDVFAVPHNIFSPSGRGCNALIRDGATLVSQPEDVLEELHITQLNNETRREAERIQPTTEVEATIFQQLGADPIHVDLLVRQTGLPTATVSSTLTLLELKGLVESAGPMQYCRAHFPRQ